MSFVIELRLESGDEHGHHLFIRSHSTRQEQIERPKGRTLLVCNIPPWCPGDQVKRIFAKFGQIERVDVQSKPGKKRDQEEDVEGRFKVAYIVFKEESMAKAVKQFSDSGEILYASTVEHPIITGLELYCAEYNQSFPDVQKLQGSINEWMAEFEERQSEKVDEADEGWTKVGKKKTVKLTEADQAEMKARAARKRKKGELLNFYQFQIREGKKKEIVRLREQFEADKKKIDRMRQERKFKPMNS